MLRRQRVILGLIEKAGGKLSRTRFVKYAFLLGREICLGGDSAFYDFVPHRFGPFSFALYRDMAILDRKGYIEWHRKRGPALRKGPSRAGGFFDQLAPSEMSAITALLGRYGGLTRDALIRAVYARHSWFATRSELTELLPPRMPRQPKAAVAAYTVGYEGKSVDAFFDQLLRAGIKGIADVRANPFSRKYGFARKSMSEVAANLDIEYSHFPALGIPSEKRAGLNDNASYQRLLAWYENQVLPARVDSLAELETCLRARPTALVCMERDPERCHRSRIAKALSERGHLDLIHL